MKRIFYTLIIILLLPYFALADIDTLEGQAVDTSSTIEGSSSVDTVEGQSLVAGGGDGSVGNTSTAGATASAYQNNVYYDDFTASAGNVRYAHVYIEDSNGATACISLWNSSGTELGSCTVAPADDTPGHYYCDFGGEVAVTATTYYVGIQSSGATTVFDQGTDSDSYRYEGLTYSCGQNTSPPGTERSPGYDNLSPSIYINNSTANPF